MCLLRVEVLVLGFVCLLLFLACQQSKLRNLEIFDLQITCMRTAALPGLCSVLSEANGFNIKAPLSCVHEGFQAPCRMAYY